MQLTHLMYVAHVFDEVAWENFPDNSLICLNVAYAFGYIAWENLPDNSLIFLNCFRDSECAYPYLFINMYEVCNAIFALLLLMYVV